MSKGDIAITIVVAALLLIGVIFMPKLFEIEHLRECHEFGGALTMIGNNWACITDEDGNHK